MNFQTNTYNCPATAGDRKDIGADCNVLIIEKCTGNLVIYTSGGSFTAKAGRVYRSDIIGRVISISSDTANDKVTLTYGRGLILETEGVGTPSKPTADDGYSLAVGNKLYQPTPLPIGVGNSVEFATEGFPIGTIVIGGNVTATLNAHALVAGMVQGNIMHVPVIDLQNGIVYYDGKIPGSAFGAQYKFRIDLAAMDHVWIYNNSDVPLSAYPSFGNGSIGPHL